MIACYYITFTVMLQFIIFIMKVFSLRYALKDGTKKKNNSV